MLSAKKSSTNCRRLQVAIIIIINVIHDFFICTNIVNVALVLDGEVNEAGHTTGFQGFDHVFGILKIATEAVSGLANFRTDMMWSCSKKL